MPFTHKYSPFLEKRNEYFESVEKEKRLSKEAENLRAEIDNLSKLKETVEIQEKFDKLKGLKTKRKNL